jgi:TatA/E family protein of Tat protein translocase
MVGGWEILVLLVLVAIFFGYRYLPKLGRSAGEGARQLKEGAGKHAESAKAYVDEQAPKARAYVDERTPDAAEVGRTAGKHVREYRELKDEILATDKKDADQGPSASEPGGSA